MRSITDRRDHAIFFIPYQHGLRASELGLFRRENLDLKALRLIVHRVKGSAPIHWSRTRRTRTAPSPILFPSRRGQPTSPRMLDVLMKEYTRAAKLSQAILP
jgi:site-specific recombinase XerC